MALLRSSLRPLVNARLARSYGSLEVSRTQPLDEPLAFSPKLSSKALDPVTNITTLSNGVKIGTYETYGPTSTIAVVLKAGPRYEDSHSVGAAHFLKHFSFQSTTNWSHVRLSREVELLGGNISATLTREHLIYSAEFLRGDLPYFVELLSEVANSPRFKRYEVEDVAHVIESETQTALANPKIAVVEALHRAAFHNTLGNSLYASPSSAHHITPEILQKYLVKNSNASQVALVGSGVNHDDLTSLSSKVFSAIAPQGGAVEPAKYHGGDLRIENVSDPLNRYVVAFEGSAANSQDAAAFQVLAKVLGGEKAVKWGSGASILSRTTAKLPFPSLVASFNLAYSDSGLFGLYVEAKPKDIKDAVHAGLGELKKASTGVSAEDLARGKAQAKLANAYDANSSALDDIIQQVSGNHQSPAHIAQALDKVTAEDVVRVAKKALQSKPTAVAYGDVLTAPYASQLSL